MIEAGVVLDTNHEPIYWHLPDGRTSGSIPDTQELWHALWRAHERGVLGGFAHSHPGSGIPAPSGTDISTFAAIEAALGRRLDWWITSDTHVVRVQWLGEPDNTYHPQIWKPEPAWVDKLRRISNNDREAPSPASVVSSVQ